ncbi:sensor domain-containing diguanylate cyclase [Bradyrhizobium sp. ARR65]|uniref:sensor domain-containing diguanylate cyclase n=1 Tax=Bradyrhizobium sp. ARR65 TaxID=1040989 RepID=UPI000465F283|nr:sensor domain-containing diguanylate cyclase [Bradyrhizobium sp. ARR65]
MNNEWVGSLQQFVDGISSSVAVIAPSTDRGFPITAWNANFIEMVGRPRLGRVGPPYVESLFPTYARRELVSKIEQCFATLEPMELEQAYDFSDKTHWWRLSLKPFRVDAIAQGQYQVLLSGIDITAKMRLLKDLEVSTSRFRLVVDAAYDAIISIDHEQRIVLFNCSAEILFGYSREEILGKSIEILIPEANRAHHRTHVNRFATSPIQSRQMEERNRVYGRRRDGSTVPLQIAISKINNGGLVEFTAIVRDISEQVRLTELLEEQATTDELTGLPNRRQLGAFVEELDCLRRSYAALLVDIDHFKSINDRFGHDVGDEVLRSLASVLRSAVSPDQLLARIGGEEFVFVLEGASSDEARSFAEEVRAMVQALPVPAIGNKPLTVSIGVATTGSEGTDLSAVLKRADDALYRAKGNGRNRVEMAA